MRQRILFFSESITLAQVVRLVALARSLHRELYEVHFASAHFDPMVFAGTDFIRHNVRSIDPGVAATAVRQGRRIYSEKILLEYVDEDRRVLDQVRPALVVGDFRLSLVVSAPLAGVRHAALINAYWSPFEEHGAIPMPDHPVVSWFGETIAARFFPCVVSRAFAHFAAPLNELRRSFGFSPIGSLREVLTFADDVLYADAPGLVATRDLPSSHRYLGPVLWAPNVGEPTSFELPSDRPIVYVTMGSSGDIGALPAIVEALATLPVWGLVATAMRVRLPRIPSNVRMTDFVRGDVVARRSSLVVSNGGSSTSYQALAEGVPVLGIASNLDQWLAISAIERAGAGISLRASTLTARAVRRAIEGLLAGESYRLAARKIARDFEGWSFAERFREFVKSATRQSGYAASLAVIVCLALFAGHARAEPPPITNEVRFELKVDGSKGHVVCALFRSNGWLKTPADWKRASISGGEAECVFTGVAPGVYGISAFHDENDNNRLDTNFLGIPTESWCTSRNAKAYFGPPSFGDAQFRYTSGVLRLAGSLK